MKEYITPVLKLFTVVALLSIIYSQNKTIKQYKDIASDSSSELFQTETQLTRYQVALELLREQDSTAADKFDLILTTQTE